MHFDLFHELSLAPCDGRDEARMYADALDEIALADTLGFTTAWLVEHHFMPEYSHATAPEMFLAAASQRTQRLRLGHAVVPLPYHHPLRVAERLATLDVLSGGRVEFGFGRGFSPTEYAAFGVAMADSRALTEEAFEILRLSFTGEPVRFHGKHFHFDDLPLLPRCVQRPHPPLWTAAVSPDSFELAARLGVGVLVGPFKPWFMVHEDIRRYRAHWRSMHGDGPPLPGQNPRVAMTLGIHCHADRRQARREAKQAFEWFYRRLLGQTRPILEQLYAGYEYYRRFGALSGLVDKAVNLTLLNRLGMAVVGDPDDCIERLCELEAAGVDHVLLAFGAGAMPTAAVREAMQLFADRVMPAFAED
ncbi:MAG: LLM class flavin-dependent oxidoreductase [Chromatiales bacterium]|jgi:alkanesulfonate monooxygenase SsuD/methylene tetrahydromethanopterin reductase-like flavin-dependent oxidoreductase (luciferase family)|nr:LLM class flavin-dependent oxidoreductase [Chromatiales bacterium]MDX9766405.1 LLM class flavin-dependent oxidoreductase [Ectothiorhodospiraceae bacterium]